MIGPLKNYLVQLGPDDEHKRQFAFNLVPRDSFVVPQRVWHMYAVNPTEKNEWVDVINHTISGVIPVTKLAVEVERSLKMQSFEIPESEIEFTNNPSLIKKGKRDQTYITQQVDLGSSGLEYGKKRRKSR